MAACSNSTSLPAVRYLTCLLLKFLMFADNCKGFGGRRILAGCSRLESNEDKAVDGENKREGAMKASY
jgi:hypothetical protein